MEDFTHAAIVIPTREGRICLAERLPGTRMAGMNSPPGGMVEPEDATLAAAGCRELEEETGLKVPPERLLYLGKVTSTSSEDWQPVGGHFFLLPLQPGEELERKEPESNGPWQWYPYAEAAKLPVPEAFKSLLLAMAHGATK